VASGSTRIGRAFRRLGLLIIPEEIRPPAIFHRREGHLREYTNMPEDGLRALVLDETTRARHFAFVAPPPRRRGAPDPAHLTAERKIAEAESVDEALQWLNKPERIQVAGDIALANRLASLGAPPAQRLPEAATG
jgi:membrane glycosyltransferase